MEQSNHHSTSPPNALPPSPVCSHLGKHLCSAPCVPVRFAMASRDHLPVSLATLPEDLLLATDLRLIVWVATVFLLVLKLLDILLVLVVLIYILVRVALALDWHRCKGIRLSYILPSNS